MTPLISLPFGGNRMMTATPAEENVRCLGASGKPGILVVDDDAFVRQFLDRALQLHGFHVWLATSGADAVGIYQNHRENIDLVLLDVKMPGLDGPATLHALEKCNPAVRTAFMSGNFGHYTADDLRRRGAKDIIQKPFDVEELAARLRRLLLEN
jgi:DNA-binding response OmpR family regulator